MILIILINIDCLYSNISLVLQNPKLNNVFHLYDSLCLSGHRWKETNSCTEKALINHVYIGALRRYW